MTTGMRGAKLLKDVIENDVQPTMAMVKVPVITGAILGGTDGNGAFAQLMRQTKELEKFVLEHFYESFPYTPVFGPT